MKNGILIDYHYCTGCHTCEVACQMDKGLPPDRWGIKLAQIGPFKYAEDRWQLTYIPTPTELCDLCAERTAKGKLPSCVHNCQADVMKYGPVSELAKLMGEGSRQVLFTIK